SGTDLFSPHRRQRRSDYPCGLAHGASAAPIRALGREPIGGATIVPIGLWDPVVDRLRRRLKLPSELSGSWPAGTSSTSRRRKVAGVRRTGLGHRELLFPRKRSGVHEGGGTSVHLRCGSC